MPNPNPLLLKAAQLLEQARAVRERYSDDQAPNAEDARQIKRLLVEAATAKKQAEQDDELKAAEDWFTEPVYKHEMTGGPDDLGSPGHKGMVPGGGDDSRPPYGERLSKSTANFMRWMAKGEYSSPEVKASIVEDANGQTLVPVDYAGTILKEMSRLGVIRGRAFIKPTRRDRVDVGAVTVGTPTWGRLEVGGGPPADALGAVPTKQTITVHELTALAKIGVDELADADEAPEVLAGVVRDAVAGKFAEVEDDAYANGGGDAATRPSGIAWRCVAAGGSVITQGKAAATSATILADDLKSLIYSVPAWARTARSCFMASADAAAAIATLKTSGGEYLLQRDASAPDPDTLFGYPFFTVEGLPSMATAGVADPSVIFGDPYAGYWIADRQQFTVQRLNERFAEAGLVGFLFKLRAGGDVTRPKAFSRLLL